MALITADAMESLPGKPRRSTQNTCDTKLANLASFLFQTCQFGNLTRCQNGYYNYFETKEEMLTDFKVAMKDAGIDYVYQTIYEITHTCLLRLLGE